MATAANNQNNNGVEFADSGGEASLAEQFDLQHYLRILRKYKWAIALFTALVTLLAAYYAYTATPIYRSTATLLIESQGNNIVSVEELVGVETQDADYYQTQFELLKSRELARRVVSKLNLTSHPDLVPGEYLRRGPAPAETNVEGHGTSTDFVTGVVSKAKNTFAKVVSSITGNEATEVTDTAVDVVSDTGVETASDATNDPVLVNLPDDVDMEVLERQVVNRYLSLLSVEPIRKTKLVKISFQSADSSFAADVANTHGEEYILAYLDAKMELTTKASSWLNDRLVELKAKLDLSEDSLIAYKEANGLVDVDGSVARLKEQDLLLLTNELAQVRSELSEVADLRREARSLAANPTLLETIPAIQNDALVRDLKIEIGRNQRDLDELGTRYGPRHPKILDTRSKLSSLEGSLRTNIQRVVESIDKEFKLLNQRVSSIQSTINSGKQEIQAVGSKRFELEALEREVTTNRELYDTFFSRMTEASSTKDIESANARVSDYAVPASSPIKPKKPLIIALGALGALVLSVLMAFLYEQMDDTIKSTGDIEEKLGVHLLGILPLIKAGLFKGRKELPLNPADIADKKGTFFEAVNTARTGIALEDETNHRKVILVTSSIPGEGKSTTAMNLAYSFSQMEKVLLIDCDLRKPSIAKAIGVERSSPGISSLLAGKANARECIHRQAIGELDLICSGPSVDQPLELLSSARFSSLIERLRGHYDRIIIDSAPTQAVSDSLVLSRLSDGVVYVIKSHSTSLELAKRGIMRLRQVDAPIAGALITQVDIDKITSYGGDYYYQGYYDYYGYTDKAHQSSKLRISPEQLDQIRNDDGLDHGDFGLNGVSKPINGATPPMNGATPPMKA